MDFTTSLGMFMSGVGIGMGRPMQEVVIHADRQQGATVLCVAAVGTPSPTVRGAPSATTTARHALPATVGSVA
jgi:DNA-binding transcriptional regulator LsrR (DeoR family)